jgi:hypothetical protein
LISDYDNLFLMKISDCSIINSIQSQIGKFYLFDVFWGETPLIISADITGEINWWDFSLFTNIGYYIKLKEEPTYIEAC